MIVTESNVNIAYYNSLYGLDLLNKLLCNVQTAMICFILREEGTVYQMCVRLALIQ